jgi:ABC-2 type transport system ATP-binding protein
MSVIEFDGLTKYYGDVRGVEDLSFSVESGEVFGFLGPNGAGKTTAIRTMLGFMRPTDGTAHVLGQDVRQESALLDAKARLGYLPGDPAFDGDVTGRRFLGLQASLKGDSRRADLLELFDPPLDRPIGEYSRGNRQMLGLVQTFMHDPDVVVMDEPTAGLDPLKQAKFNDFLAEETDRGTTVFFSSHVLSEVRAVCDRVGIIRDGHLTELADVEDLLGRSGRIVTVTVAEDVTGADFDFKGVHDLSIDSQVRFVFTGEYDRLIECLGDFTVLDLEIEEAPLEDVFMRFYETDEGADAGGETTPDAGGEADA